MKNNWRLLLDLVVLINLLYSCQSSSPASQPATDNSTLIAASATTSPPLSTNSQPSKTAIDTVQVPKAVYNPDAAGDVVAIESCVSIQEYKDTSPFQGVLLIQENVGNDALSPNWAIFGLTLPLLEPMGLPLNKEELYFGLILSPSGSSIAYREINEQGRGLLIIQDTSGSRQLVMDWPPAWEHAILSRWLTEETILVQLNPGNFSEQVAFNITSRKSVSIPTDFDIVQDAMEFAWSGYSLIQPDPTLRFVFYPKYTGEGPRNPTFVFEDLDNHKEIETPIQSFMFTRPLWSSTGKFLIMEGAIENGGSSQEPAFFADWNDIVYVDIHGDARQLTTFSNSPMEIDRESIALSPDNRFVTFAAGPDRMWDQRELYLYDLLSDTLYNLCLPLGEGLSSGIVWSPDSQMIAVHARSHQSASSTTAWIVDFFSRTAYEMGMDVMPIGWMR